MNKPVAWMSNGKEFYVQQDYCPDFIPLYTHLVKEQDNYCKAYWGNNNNFVDVFLPNSETEVIRFWNNTHPVKELTDDEIHDLMDEIRNAVGDDIERAMYCMARAILRKAQEK